MIWEVCTWRHVIDGEMVQELVCQPSEAAVGRWAEAWAIRAYLLMSFFLIVCVTLSASILGIGARKCDRLDDMFHPKAALEGSFDRACGALLVQYLVAARRAYEMPNRTLINLSPEVLEADCAVKGLLQYSDVHPAVSLSRSFISPLIGVTAVHRQQNSSVPELNCLLVAAGTTDRNQDPNLKPPLLSPA